MNSRVRDKQDAQELNLRFYEKAEHFWFVGEIQDFYGKIMKTGLTKWHLYQEF